jgi:hypothetical protein
MVAIVNCHEIGQSHPHLGLCQRSLRCRNIEQVANAVAVRFDSRGIAWVTGPTVRLPSTHPASRPLLPAGEARISSGERYLPDKVFTRFPSTRVRP